MSWQRVRGHERLVDAFDRVVRRGRLGHAYLFAGPPGVGKRLFAEELARALLCESPARTRLEACDLCPACRQVAAGTHPDLFIAGKPEESLELPIDVMRDLCRSFSLKSARDRGKVVILDDADDLNEESANCFLKTLEEPPPRSVLLLIGTSPDRQLATIRSRCQVVHFAPLADELVAELLRAQGVEDSALIERLVRLSGGSPGRARALADPALWEFRRQMLGQLSRSPVDTVGLARSWMRFVEEAGKEAAAQRQRAAQVLERCLVSKRGRHAEIGGAGRPARTGGTGEAHGTESTEQRARPLSGSRHAYRSPRATGAYRGSAGGCAWSEAQKRMKS